MLSNRNRGSTMRPSEPRDHLSMRHAPIALPGPACTSRTLPRRSVRCVIARRHGTRLLPIRCRKTKLYQGKVGYRPGFGKDPRPGEGTGDADRIMSLRGGALVV